CPAAARMLSPELFPTRRSSDLSTNLLDPEGTTDSEYRIAIEGASASEKPVPGGSQGKNLVWASEAVTPWESSHLDVPLDRPADLDRKSTRLNSSHVSISSAVFC